MSRQDLARKICDKSMMRVPLPAIYLFRIKEIQQMHILVKYGLTRNLYRRTIEHSKTYGSHISLECHSYVDPFHLLDAERNVRSFFKSSGWHIDYNTCTKLSYPKSKELAIVPISELEHVMILYENIGKFYQKQI